MRHIHGTDPTPTFGRSDAVTRPPEARKAGRAQGAGRATGARGAGRHIAGDGAYGRTLLLHWRSAPGNGSKGLRSRRLVPCGSPPTRSAAPRSAKGHARARSPRCKAPAVPALGAIPRSRCTTGLRTSLASPQPQRPPRAPARAARPPRRPGLRGRQRAPRQAARTRG